VLEQEICNERVGFEGRNDCDNTMYVHDVPSSFVKALTSGRNSVFLTCHTAEKRCLWKGGDETEALPDITA